MSSIQFGKLVTTIGAAASLLASPAYASIHAQEGPQSPVFDLSRGRAALDTIDDTKTFNYEFDSRADSVSWEKSRSVADKATGFHIVVSLKDAHLWAIIGADTVLSAPVAVAKGTTLKYAKQTYTFKMPRGIRTVLRKESDPVWQPPDWLYVETAQEYGLKLAHLGPKSRVKVDGGFLTMRDNQAGILSGAQFDTLPIAEHIVFGDTLYIPPLGSKNRKVEGELGKFRLDMGEGFLLHGTPYKDSIGLAATHGCVRMRDEDIEWLYDHIPVGTKVYIY